MDKGKKATACHENAIKIGVFNVKDWKHSDVKTPRDTSQPANTNFVCAYDNFSQKFYISLCKGMLYLVFNYNFFKKISYIIKEAVDCVFEND